MALALAEVSSDKSNNDKDGNEKAAMYADEAARTFSKLTQLGPDSRMEALAYIAVARIHCMRKLPTEAIAAATKAWELSRSFGDLVVSAKALHELGHAHILSEEVEQTENGMKNG